MAACCIGDLGRDSEMLSARAWLLKKATYEIVIHIVMLIDLL